MIYKIKIPRLGVNENTITIVEWLVKKNDWVSVNQPLCRVETSKVLFEICSEQSGFLNIRVPERKEVKIQETIGYVTDSKNAVIPEESVLKLTENIKKGNLTIVNKEILATKKARELAQKLNIDLKDINKKGLIKKVDIEKFAGTKKIQKISSKGKIKIAIYGAGSGGRVAKECAELTNKYQVVYFIDDDPSLINTYKDGLKVLDGSDLSVLVSLGVKKVFSEIIDSDFRLGLKKRLEKVGIEMINLIHPSSYIAPTVKLGKGNFIKAGAIIDTNTSIGNCCIIDNNVIIAHDNIIADGCHLAPGVSLGSDISIGKKTIVGIGASVATKVKIGNNVIVGVGSSVVQDIPDNSIVEGVPGKIIGTRKIS